MCTVFQSRKTQEWAVDLIANHSAMPRYQIALEVDRYITWPGQACAYKIGEMEIKRWRAKAEEKLGKKRCDINLSDAKILTI